ncbi:histone-lysine N-methyltransferase PRDM9-like [Penaeus monodon]|uniref:histone-lysine N-methyltransferase PRDM9-like n=1 Tax=Penaeus monodon TaxID=6687 RepID=UPI0018A6F2FD|nr:histone-lysine N-methyltransferase PRDM9-like [Penaeus monodon]
MVKKVQMQSCIPRQRREKVEIMEEGNEYLMKLKVFYIKTEDDTNISDTSTFFDETKNIGGKINVNDFDLKVKDENTHCINDASKVFIKLENDIDIKDECSYDEETECFDDTATESDFIHDGVKETTTKDPLLLVPFVIEEYRKIQSTNSDQMVQRRTKNATANKVVQKKDKPFHCDVCNKDFSRKDKIQTHMKLHTKENLYTCEVCNKQFTLKDSLAKHFIVHSNEKPFSCG